MVQNLQDWKNEQLSLKIILNKDQFHLKFIMILSVMKVMKVLLKKYQDHIPCSFAHKLVCVDDKFIKPIVVLRGENAAY